MERYKKANEGIHAPEELKKNAVQPRPSRVKWFGAVAAMLAVVLLAGIALWPGRGPVSTAEGPTPSNSLALQPGGWLDSIIPPHSDPGRATTLAAAVYPEMAPYPNQEDYTKLGGYDLDWDRYEEAYSAWWEDIRVLRSEQDFTEALAPFVTSSTAEFLSGAGSENRVYSPLNVYMALAMLTETTDGNSRQQLLDLLGADSVETLREQAQALWRENYRSDGLTTSVLANSMWLAEGWAYHQDTLDILARDYYASAFSGEMGTEEYDQALRNWIDQQTGGLLKEQANGLEMDPETILALASTIYFKAPWADDFNADRTAPDTFHAPSGDVTVDFMHKTDDMTYYWGDHFSAISLSFDNGFGDMWLILPDEGTSPDELLTDREAMDFLLADKHGTYNEETWEPEEPGWEGQKRLEVNLSLPKFDVSSDLDLIGGLQALGVTDVFDPDISDFTPLTDVPELYVSQAQHAARVVIDEEGCEAASYTVITVNAESAPLGKEVDFTLDRPFIFAITGPSGLPLFVGVVNHP